MTTTTAAMASQSYLLGRLRLLEQRARDAIADLSVRLTDPLAGAFLTTDHVAGLFERGKAPLLGPAGGPERVALEAAADEAEAEGADVRLRTMAVRFGLDDVDVELLLVAIAPEVDARFEHLYGLLNDDATLRRATAGLALRLAGVEAVDPEARDRLGPAGVLVRSGLLIVGGADRPFPTRGLRVPDRVVDHVVGGDTTDVAVAPLVTDPPPAGIQGAESVAAVLGERAALCYVRARIGASGAAFGRAVAGGLGAADLCVDLTRPGGPRDPQSVSTTVAAALREAQLRGAVLVLGPAEALAGSGDTVDRLVAAAWPVVLYGELPWDPSWAAAVPVLVDAPVPRPAELADLCRQLLEGSGSIADAAKPEVLAPFSLAPEQIVRAVEAATLRAALAGREPLAEDLRAGARSQTPVDLAELTRHTEPTATWSTLVLPPHVFDQLEELRLRVVLSPVVLDDWGMRESSRRGGGVTALFCGAPGTGKTLSAEVLASELGVDLYTVDLSTVVDKYIGETEKNLERIFDRAERVHGVLFFDEADALFGKRSEVKDAHDRYANIETAYLLQRIEAFEGLVVLATNLRANLDDAFARRLDCIIDFPVPGPADRLRLWRSCLGPAPLADNVDLTFCADRFELVGGNIRNAALTAALFAAKDGGPISMPDLVWAVHREYKKLGRLCTEQEFGTWWKVIAA